MGVTAYPHLHLISFSPQLQQHLSDQTFCRLIISFFRLPVMLFRIPQNNATKSSPAVQVFMMIQNCYDMSYSEILARSNRTTRRIWYTAAAITLAVIFRRRVDMAARSLLTGALSLVSGAF